MGTLRNRRVTLGVGLLVMVAMLLGGCASKYGPQITNVKYYRDCYQPISDLREAEKSFNRTVAGSVAGGAIAGAMIGLLITGKASGAIAGAVAGGVAGGAMGYALAKQRQIADDNQRMASYLQDLDGDITGIDRVTAAARLARQCYDKQFELAVAEFKAGHLTRPELDERYLEISNGSTEAGKILGVVVTSGAEKQAQYQAALTEEAKLAKRDVPDPTLAPPPPAPEPEPAPKSKKAKVKKAKATPPPVEAKPTQAKDADKPAPSKYAAAESGDKLVDMSTRNAKFGEKLDSVKAEQKDIEEAAAKRQKTLEQLTG